MIGNRGSSNLNQSQIKGASANNGQQNAAASQPVDIDAEIIACLNAETSQSSKWFQPGTSKYNEATSSINTRISTRQDDINTLAGHTDIKTSLEEIQNTLKTTRGLFFKRITGVFERKIMSNEAIINKKEVIDAFKRLFNDGVCSVGGIRKAKKVAKLEYLLNQVNKQIRSAHSQEKINQNDQSIPQQNNNQQIVNHNLEKTKNSTNSMRKFIQDLQLRTTKVSKEIPEQDPQIEQNLQIEQNPQIKDAKDRIHDGYNKITELNKQLNDLKGTNKQQELAFQNQGEVKIKNLTQVNQEKIQQLDQEIITLSQQVPNDEHETKQEQFHKQNTELNSKIQQYRLQIEKLQSVKEESLQELQKHPIFLNSNLMESAKTTLEQTVVHETTDAHNIKNAILAKINDPLSLTDFHKQNLDTFEIAVKNIKTLREDPENQTSKANESRKYSYQNFIVKLDANYYAYQLAMERQKDFDNIQEQMEGFDKIIQTLNESIQNEEKQIKRLIIENNKYKTERSNIENAINDLQIKMEKSKQQLVVDIEDSQKYTEEKIKELSKAIPPIEKDIQENIKYIENVATAQQLQNDQEIKKILDEINTFNVASSSNQ